ncbi:linoleate 13S-lipoxygenase 2-1, chloroplastic-like [Salvia divinorum]|uniref:Linoleate 13S-lipoxygenase 2-1, chloroplastic-like n=1 Tax=Salvia divinorum TaxID=28513 RepID=A0ABD1HXZ9_SALDI
MHRNQRFGRWNLPVNWRDTESNWRIREVANPVITRSGLSTAEPVPLSSGSEGDPETPQLIKQESDLF